MIRLASLAPLASHGSRVGGHLHCPSRPSHGATVIGKDDMDDDRDAELRIVHQRVCVRWRRIDWTFDAFRMHVGEERPPHLEDLYLGGAAGHRRPGAWESLHDEVSVPVTLRLRRQPCGTFTPEDLVSESIAVLMEDDDRTSPGADGTLRSKIVRYRGRTSLVNYFLVVAKRIAIGSHRRRREHPAEVEVLDPADRGGTSPDQASTPEDLDRMQGAIRAAYRALTARQRFLLAMIHGQGMPKAQAGELVGLPPWGVSRELDRIHDSVGQALISVLPDGWDPPSREAWEVAWRRCWSEEQASRIEDPASPGGTT